MWHDRHRSSSPASSPASRPDDEALYDEEAEDAHVHLHQPQGGWPAGRPRLFFNAARVGGGGWRAAAMFVLNRTVWVADSDSPLGSSVRGLRQAFNFYEGRRSSAVAHGSPYAFLDFLPFVSRFLSLRIGFENRFDRLDYGRFLAGELRRQRGGGRGCVIRDVRMCAHAACVHASSMRVCRRHTLSASVGRPSLSFFPVCPVSPLSRFPVCPFSRFPVSPCPRVPLVVLSGASSSDIPSAFTSDPRVAPCRHSDRHRAHAHTHTVTVTTVTTTAAICRTLDV